MLCYLVIINTLTHYLGELIAMSRRQFIAATCASLIAISSKLSAQMSRSDRILERVIPATGEQLPIIGLGILEN